jgi:hypothetical protein
VFGVERGLGVRSTFQEEEVQLAQHAGPVALPLLQPSLGWTVDNVEDEFDGEVVTHVSAPFNLKKNIFCKKKLDHTPVLPG